MMRCGDGGIDHPSSVRFCSECASGLEALARVREISARGHALAVRIGVHTGVAVARALLAGLTVPASTVSGRRDQAPQQIAYRI